MDKPKRYEKKSSSDDRKSSQGVRKSAPRSDKSIDKPIRASRKPGFKVGEAAGYKNPRKTSKTFGVGGESDSRESDKRSSDKSFGEKKHSEKKFSDRKPREDRSSDRKFSDRKPREDRPGDRKFSDRKPREDRPGDRKFSDRKPREDRPGDIKFSDRRPREDRPGDRKFSDRRPREDRPGDRKFGAKKFERTYRDTDHDSDESTEFRHKSLSSSESSWRLNKYIANSGVSSRREADTIIADGKVNVNGVVVTEMGHKVTNKDKVTVDGVEVHPEDFTYILMNKPKNHITTVEDEKGRTTVMDLIKDATGLRVYPVGRLDRNTTGLLLLTNDGDLANRLMHPSYKVKKTYIVETDIPMTDAQILEMRQGITLDDGVAAAHEARRVPGSPNALKISIFEGRNRQIRRMIEYFKLEVIKLHRTYYAGLTVADVRPGRWRFLKEKEVNDLRMLVKLFDLKQK